MSKTFRNFTTTENGKSCPSKVPELLKRVGRHCDGEGLWLFVASERSASWIFRYSSHGRQRDMGLGAARDVSLADARALAGKARNIRALGGDPMEARRSEATANRLQAFRNVTFKSCAEEYIAAHESGWKNPKHRQQWRNTLATYVYPAIGPMAVQDISTDDIVKLLKPIWHSKRETARRVRARVEMVLDAAAANDARTGKNPAAWDGHLEHLLGTVKKVVRHHPSMPFGEVPAFVHELENQAGVAALALRFLIFTVSRPGEVLGANRREIHHAGALWAVPAIRMKAGREHKVPLSAAAIAVLDDPGTHDGLIFRASSLHPALSNAAMAAVIARMGLSGITVHGFRASFRTFVQETRPDDRLAAEAALAHSIGDQTEQAYVREALGRRRLLMDAWGEYCTSVSTAAAAIRLAS
jgi:integrase